MTHRRSHGQTLASVCPGATDADLKAEVVKWTLLVERPASPRSDPAGFDRRGYNHSGSRVSPKPILVKVWC